jgi:hypothetical protein
MATTPNKVNELKLGPTSRESDKVTALNELERRLNDTIRAFNQLIDEVLSGDLGGGGTSGVASFNGRLGVVVPQAGDYTYGMVGAVGSADARLADARNPLPHTHPQADVVGLIAALAARELVANRGVAGGYASLGVAGLVPFAQLGTGIATGTKFLRDDQTWQDPSVGGGGSGVSDFNGRVGSVVPAIGDYTYAMVTNAVGTADARLSDARTPTAHTHAQVDVIGLTAALAARELSANKGAANGYAPLDAGSKVPVANLPGSLAAASRVYWLVLVERTQNFGDLPRIGEIVFRATSGGASLNAGGTPIFTSQFASSGDNSAAAAFDGNAATAWAAANSNGSNGVGLQLAAASPVLEVVITARNDGFGPNGAPIQMRILSSTDNVSWITEWMILTPATWAAGTARTFTKPV